MRIQRVEPISRVSTSIRYDKGRNNSKSREECFEERLKQARQKGRGGK